MPKSLSAAEVAAGKVIAAHLGVPVEQHDDGSQPGMYDLTICYPDGRRGAVEVTAAEDQAQAADYGALRRRPILHDSRLTNGWLVVAQRGADVNRLREELPDLLHQLERQGITEASVYSIWSPEGQAEWASGAVRAVGAETVKATTSFDTGTIALTGAMTVDWLSQDPEDVVAFVDRFVAARPSDVAKLGRSGAEERHLFVWSGVFSEGRRELRALGLDVAALPSRAPNLPPAVTHVWIAPEAMRPSRVVTWSAATGWEAAATLT